MNNITPIRQYAKGTKVFYDPRLIGRFHHEHQMLLQMFNRLSHALDKGATTEAMRALSDFKSALTDHLLTENTKLYIYLRHEHDDEPETDELIKSFASEMGEIGKSVMAFLRGATQNPASMFTIGFKEQLGQIGQALIQRIQREEKILYPLYTAPKGGDV